MDVYGKSNSYAITNIDNINYLVRKNSCGVYGDAYQLGSSSVNFLEYIDDKVIVSGWEDSKGTYMYLFDKNGKSIEKKESPFIYRYDEGVYGYKKDNCANIIVPNQFFSSFNELNFKEIVSKVSDSNLDKISVSIRYNKDEEKKYFEALINFGDIDTIHVPFKITEKREFMFYPFIYSSISKKENVLSNEENLLPYSNFIFAFCNSFLVKDMIYLMSIEEEVRDREDSNGISYVKKRIEDFEY